MSEQPIIPDRIQADDTELQKWLDRVFVELEAYNSFPRIIAIVSQALARFADQEARRHSTKTAE